MITYPQFNYPRINCFIVFNFSEYSSASSLKRKFADTKVPPSNFYQRGQSRTIFGWATEEGSQAVGQKATASLKFCRPYAYARLSRFRDV
jgi:hypothetical protein